MRYTWQLNLFEGQTTVELQASGIQIMRPGSETWMLPYADVTRVNLRRTQGGRSTYAYYCRVESRSLPALELRSEWSKLLWGEQPPEPMNYYLFVEQLHRRLIVCQPPPQFIAGASRGSYLLQFLPWVVMPLVVVLLFASVPFPSPTLFALLGGSVAVGIAYWYRTLRHNRPRPYDPSAIPPELLPPVKSALP